MDAVLEALHVVRSNTPPAATGGSNQSDRGTDLNAGGTPGMERLGGDPSEACAADVEMQDARSPGTPKASPDASRNELAKVRNGHRDC